MARPLGSTAPRPYTKNAGHFLRRALRYRLRTDALWLCPLGQCSRPLAAHLYLLRTSPRSWRPTSRPCTPPPACRCACCGLGVIDRAADAASSRAGWRKKHFVSLAVLLVNPGVVADADTIRSIATHIKFC